MPSFMLRAIDPALWAAFKAKCQADGHPMRWVVLELIRRYTEDGFVTAGPPVDEAERAAWQQYLKDNPMPTNPVRIRP